MQSAVPDGFFPRDKATRDSTVSSSNDSGLYHSLGPDAEVMALYCNRWYA